MTTISPELKTPPANVLAAILNPRIPQKPSMLERNIYQMFYAAIYRGPATVGLSPRRCRALAAMDLYYQELEQVQGKYLELLNLLKSREDIMALLTNPNTED